MRLSHKRIELESSLRRWAHERQGRVGEITLGLNGPGMSVDADARVSQPRIGGGERGIPGNGLLE